MSLPFVKLESDIQLNSSEILRDSKMPARQGECTCVIGRGLLHAFTAGVNTDEMVKCPQTSLQTAFTWFS